MSLNDYLTALIKIGLLLKIKGCEIMYLTDILLFQNEQSILQVYLRTKGERVICFA
jgi:hypothetical protein